MRLLGMVCFIHFFLLLCFSTLTRARNVHLLPSFFKTFISFLRFSRFRDNLRYVRETGERKEMRNSLVRTFISLRCLRTH